ncbi:uncharacterized protein LOC128471293 isoform X3 [Spea bombifrons]|uniref:uncharacterized protein LOC128471293 isoform X3 n=1 Tax=Spea bombifrons TaxID=233779 RepID=UPI00234935C9|nr:uncharacterized protein LOC128471293 isoform X3 [Spea bombifrons]
MTAARLTVGLGCFYRAAIKPSRCRWKAMEQRTSDVPGTVGGVRSMYRSTEVQEGVQVVDLRSDTVTQPCAEMRKAMAEAKVGDDVYGEDPTVNEIQRRAAQILGTEDALFVTSGTMGNLISVMCHCRTRGAEIIVGDESHMYIYEQGGAAQIAGVFVRPVRTLSDGRLDLKDLESKIQHGFPDPHYAETRLICLENSHNRMGGRVLPVSYMEEGLGAPVGSLLGGTAQFVADARRVRKLLGGGMRQAGVLAAAGLVALNRAQENVTLDHQNAKMFAKGVQEIGSPLCTSDPAAVETNIVLLTMNEKLLPAQDLCEQLSAVSPAEIASGQGVSVRALSFSPSCVRMVWHRDISELNTRQALEKLKQVLRRNAGVQS